jgi:hypothetical protein
MRDIRPRSGNRQFPIQKRRNVAAACGCLKLWLVLKHDDEYDSGLQEGTALSFFGGLRLILSAQPDDNTISMEQIQVPYIMVDVESDGPIPGDYSMVCFGAVIVEPALDRTFYGQLKPVSENYIRDALAVSGFSREQCLCFDDPKSVMEHFRDWLGSNCKGRCLFVSDNNGFDWQFINWYFHHFTGANPFGFSSTNLGSLYKGLQKDTFVNFKHLRKMKHTHHPVDDARGNAEALLQMKDMGLKISFA